MTVQEQYQQLEKTILSYNPGADIQKIREAFEFADKCHSEQKRKSGEPYIIHPLAVAQIVAEELLNGVDDKIRKFGLVVDVIKKLHLDFSVVFYFLLCFSVQRLISYDI